MYRVFYLEKLWFQEQGRERRRRAERGDYSWRRRWVELRLRWDGEIGEGQREEKHG